MSRNLGPALALLLLGSCASRGQGDPEADPARSGCRYTLPARGDVTRLPTEIAAERRKPSRIIAHAELRLSRLAQELEAKVEKRVAEARDVSIGVAGVVHYSADRGPFTLSIEGDSLIVRSEIRAHAQACSGGRCYASCDPIAVARAEVPLRLSQRYAFDRSRVTTAFTRGCKVRALGGFLSIDVTPTIEARLAPELAKIERTIDQRLPNLQAQASRLWVELEKPRSLPLGGCVVVQPRGIVQGPVGGDASTLRLRFALLAEPEIRTRCGHVPLGSPLPPLAQDRTLPAEEEVVLALVAPLDGVASALQATPPVERAVVADAGNALDADLALEGDVCGDLSLRASLAWADDGRSLTLASPKLAPAERKRVVEVSVDPDELAVRLTRAPRIPLPLDPHALAQVVPLLASSQSSDELEVSADVSSVRPATAAARGDDLVAWVRVRGRLDLKQK